MSKEQEIAELQKQLAECKVPAKEMALRRRIRELMEEQKASPVSSKGK